VAFNRDLFSEPQTSSTGPLGWVEPSVHWFTESTRPEAVASRRNVNRWYADFPDPDGRLGARLRSEVNADHYQSLDELYLHFLLTRRHTDVRYEEGGVGPDFRLYDKGKLIAGVEVASLFQQSEWTVEQARHSRLADAVNMRLLPTAGYFVDFQFEAAPQDPAPRHFVGWLRREVDRLPPHHQLALGADQSGNVPTAIYVKDEVRIRVRFIPMRAGAQALTDPDARIVGMGPAVGGMVLAASRLKERIGAKAGGRYDLGDSPFLVAVGVHDTVCSDDQVVEGLYGGESVVLASGDLIRRNDGLFGIDAGKPSGRQSRLSAVAIISMFRAWKPDETDVALLRNPYASRPWPGNGLPATREFGVVDSCAAQLTLGWKQT